MTAIQKYTHQDILDFIKDGTPPDDLACSVGFHLMRQPVRLSGDTSSDRPYDAHVARRMLEVNYTNPFTRAPIREHPALLLDAARQHGTRQFRAMLLGYTKVAAHLQEIGQPTRLGAPLLPPPPVDGPTLRQIAVGQALRNGILRSIASRPVEQPRLARHNYNLGKEAYQRALSSVRPALTAHRRGRVAADKAQRVADSKATTGRPLSKATRAVQECGIDVGLFEAAFGRQVLGLTGHLLMSPTTETLRAVASKTAHRQQSLSEVLLFQRGAVLHAVLEDQAYEALATVADALSPRTTEGWHIGPMSGSQGVYLGQTAQDQAHGMGLMVKANQAGYQGGFWQNNELHGHGCQQTASGFALGLWHRGTIQQGVISHAGMEQSGMFAREGLQGYGTVTTPERTFEGRWQQGQLVEGRIVHEASGSTALFGPSHVSDEQGVGLVRLGESGTYYGALRNGIPHGFGLLVKPNQLDIGGHWQLGALVGPGAQTLEDRVQYGTWRGNGAPLAVEEEDLDVVGDDEP